MRPAAWGQNDAGAPEDPGVVAGQRGVHTGRSVGRAEAPRWGSPIGQSFAASTRLGRWGKADSLGSFGDFPLTRIRELTVYRGQTTRPSIIAGQGALGTAGTWRSHGSCFPPPTTCFHVGRGAGVSRTSDVCRQLRVFTQDFHLLMLATK